MPTRRSSLILAATLAAAALAGCGSMQSSQPAASSWMNLTAQLTGAQEVPPKQVAGTGTADVQFDRDTGTLRYTVTYSGLTGPLTGAHIHGPAAMGANAGIVVPFANGASPIRGEAKLTPAQAGDLMAGLYYVNLHTAANPGGEIRGQLAIKR
ncbi:CHRD domain-containing protein [Ramlibacter albus]|uniref:CHRD domain-containing protein n=1 Tax=Ramlibacter albus TaxID=2079448 RepID=A0A923S1H3_9BURK|nr:CHRD domain-containing protein [Ramlibacter albus]MBC5764286.1 CHRD domain-containing protein [Ramlibacter albus]